MCATCAGIRETVSRLRGAATLAEPAAAPLAGGCLCGAVRWRTAGSPVWSGHCHCTDCRRATGAPLASWMVFGKLSVTWAGARAFHRSSPGVTRGFCPGCGTPLSYMCTRWPGELHILAATLDDPARFVPRAHVHWAERVPWLDPADALPRHPGRAPAGGVDAADR